MPECDADCQRRIKIILDSGLAESANRSVKEVLLEFEGVKGVSSEEFLALEKRAGDLQCQFYADMKTVIEQLKAL